MIRFDNNIFWKWLKIDDKNNSIRKYIELLVDNQNREDKGFIVELQKTISQKASPSIMEKLSRSVPRRYFLELHFCAKTYAYIFSKIFPPLSAFVSELAYIEWLLYTEPWHDKYRDHLVHMFKVAYVGHILLSDSKLIDRTVKWQENSQHFKEWCESQKLKTSAINWHEVVKMAFFIAAIFHDFGYGFYYNHKYQERLFRLNRWLPPGTDYLDLNLPNTNKILDSLPAYFVKKNHEWINSSSNLLNITKNLQAGFFRDCLPLNHSIASTLFVLDIAEQLWNAKAINHKLYIAFHLAAEAIMIHDMTGKDTWAHLTYSTQEKEKGKRHFLDYNSHKKVPLATLLILSDELSVWRRPRMKQELKGNNKVIYSMDDDVIESLKIKILDKEIRINAEKDSMNSLKNVFENDLNFLKKPGDDKFPSLLGYKINVHSN